MNLTNLEAPKGITFAPPDAAMAKWNRRIRAADKDDASISILDVIGGDFFGEGVTSKRIAAALRNIGERDVTVNINSPGGDLFEGIAIYNLLKDHPSNVTVKVMGMAASAASVIAMAGDNVQMGEGSFMMIHNVWVMAIGDRNALSEASERLEAFDDALASLYAARTGLGKNEISELMDAETFFSVDQAMDKGFADGRLSDEEVEEDEEQEIRSAIRMMDAGLASLGKSRKERDRLIWEFKQSVRSAIGRPDDSVDNHPADADASAIRAYLTQ